ncbi:hypothetical protein [uncultured Microbulbifer sp.]|uniref:hypothetical protein n=1 Tax=uncultured Microbulbifer sp. TaxID=348147 RepID=UPI002609CB28|nr:hypothetical protein [uncultured Microbulbifer sp.]
MTEEVSELTKALLAVIPVLSGGLIGIAGSFGVSYFQQRQKKSETLKKKAEEALQHLYRCIIWLHNYRHQCLIDGEIKIANFPPLDTAEAIVALYFPEAESELDEFTKKHSEVASVAIGLGGERIAQGEIPKDHSERWSMAFSSLKPSFNALKAKIRELSLK